MSDFVAGFASRHAVGDALTRAFSTRGGFEAISVAPAPAPRGFTTDGTGPRHFSPADPDSNPTEGWNPFDAAAEPLVPEDFVDPIAAARTAGYAEGMAAAIAEIEGAGSRDRQLLANLAETLSRASFVDRDALARRMRQTVLALVTRLVGEVGVSGDHMAERIDAAADMLADSAESSILRVHPDDVAMLTGKLPRNLFPVGDASVERGGFVLESASTIVEDGPAIWLDQLGEAIERVGVPASC